MPRGTDIRQLTIPELGGWRLSIGVLGFFINFSKGEPKVNPPSISSMLGAEFRKRNAIKKHTLATRGVSAPCILTVLNIPLALTQRQTCAYIPSVPEEKAHDPITYHRLENLGEGGFGQVRRVMDLQSGKIIAVKIIPVGKVTEMDDKRKIKNEVELLSRCDHVGLSHYELPVVSANSHV